MEFDTVWFTYQEVSNDSPALEKSRPASVWLLHTCSPTSITSSEIASESHSLKRSRRPIRGITLVVPRVRRTLKREPD
eukprot:6773126-Pyramimonas_sp.AAC.1